MVDSLLDGFVRVLCPRPAPSTHAEITDRHAIGGTIRFRIPTEIAEHGDSVDGIDVTVEWAPPLLVVIWLLAGEKSEHLRPFWTHLPPKRV